MAYNVKFLKGTKANFDALKTAGTIDKNTFYYVDEKDLYLGNILLSSEKDVANAVSRIEANAAEILLIKAELDALTGGESGTGSITTQISNLRDELTALINKNKDDIAAETKRATDAENALSGRITTLENFKNGTNGYQYVKNLTSTHTNSAVSGSPTNMIAVTANNKATGEVTININETALDNKLKEMSTAISNADAAAKAGVLSFGGKTGAITVRSGSTTSWDANFTMNNNELRGTVVPPKSKGSATQPIYFDANGNISNVGIDTTATSGSKKLITSGAVFSAVSTAQTTLQNNINNLNQINWASF